MNDEFEKQFNVVFGGGRFTLEERKPMTEEDFEAAVATLEQENRQLRARNERLEKFVAQIEGIVETSKN